ncbi:MAG: hypothetical protein ACK494_07110 [Planctomycetota bacterium]|jgi:DNA-directed RNA polymerase beta subunit
MVRITVTVSSDLDPTGEPEEFTNDLDYVAENLRHEHLDEYGLPRIGTVLKSGMVLVGILGRKNVSLREIPEAIRLTMDEVALGEYYQARLYERCKLVTPEMEGTVVKAVISSNGRCQSATIEIESSNESKETTTATMAPLQLR